MIELPKSIAVFRLSALGDVLMFLPTVRALQRNFPQAKISWIISRPAYDLVKNINKRVLATEKKISTLSL